MLNDGQECPPSISNSHYGKMDKGKIWRLIGRTGILACHLQQDRQECLSYQLLIIDTISSIPLFPFEHKFCHNENCYQTVQSTLTQRTQRVRRVQIISFLSLQSLVLSAFSASSALKNFRLHSLKNIGGLFMKCKVILFAIILLFFIPSIGITGQIDWVKYPTYLDLDSDISVSHPSVVFAVNKYHIWYTTDSGINYARSTDGVVWEKYPSNPVLQDGVGDVWDGESISQPTVLYKGGIYRMWFTGYDGNSMRIGYATSTDGVRWNKYGTNSVLNMGVNGAFDDAGASSPSVLYVNGLYRMWYVGYDGNNMRVGYATSIDGVVWNKSGTNPVLDLGTSDSFDYIGISSPSVWYDKIQYHMCYTGYDGNNMRIGYATSIDGVNWTKYGTNLVLNLGVNGAFDDVGVSSPSVLYADGLYQMWYTGYDGGNLQIGYVTSTDGVVWSKSIGNPVLKPGAAGTFDDIGVSSPSVLYAYGLYWMGYTGYDGNNMRVGYATSIDGVVWNKSIDNPVLNLGVNGYWDDAGVSAPNILYDGKLYRLFYTGYDGNNMRIGYAIAQVPLPNSLIANAGQNVSIYPTSQITLNGSATDGTPPYTYSWTPTTCLDNPHIANPIASPSTTTTYALTVTDSNGWTAQDEVVVTVSTASTIFIQPATDSLTADESVAFTCIARDNNGNTWTVTTQTTFTTNDPAGTMTANVYHPGKVGTWTITAEYSGLVATATVKVTPGNYVNINITVSATTTTTFATFTITITLYDSDGNPYSGNVSLTNSTNSIIPNTVNLISGTWTGTGTIISSPSNGIDTITAFYNKTGAMATATIMVFMNSQQGGTVTDKGVTIDFDPGDLGTANVTVHIRTATQISQPLPEEIQFAGIVYNIDIRDESGNEVGTQTGQIGTVTVHLAYPDIDNNGVVDGTQIKEKDLIIYQWEEGNWIPLDTTIIEAKNIAWAEVHHFSTFTLAGTPTIKNNLMEVIVYPNPCRVYLGQQLHFTQLTAQCTIKIFNIAGELVKEIEHTNGTDEEVWTDPGKIASGVYLYLIMNDHDQKATGKFGIIK